MKFIKFLGLLFFCAACASDDKNTTSSSGPRRFFSDDSFWNQPIAENPKIAPQNDYWVKLISNDPSCENWGINIKEYTIPVFQVDSTTPRQVIRESYVLKVGHKDFKENSLDPSFAFRQHPFFKGTLVPIPSQLSPSPGSDAHVAIVDYEQGKAWDMWYVFQDSVSGDWFSHTGMHYDLYGSGVFDPAEFNIKPGESIHQYGPGRAAGVPVMAGTIMYHEIQEGKIEHKLSCGVRYGEFQKFVYPPAIWTDGNFDGGIPEGTTIQLDPGLDLEAFDLTPAEMIVARAMQEYGMVIVDYTRGNALYAEGLWYDPERSWDGLLRDWDGGINDIPMHHFRFLDPSENIRSGGDRKKAFFTESFIQKDCD